MRGLSRTIALSVFSLGLAVSPCALAGQGAEPVEEKPASPPRVDYKVVVWFRRAQPIDTFQYQVYNLRKKEYTPAVDDWVAMMKKKHPGYEVAVRDVDVARETGPNDTRKIGAVVHRELLAAAAVEGVFLGPMAPPLQTAPSYRSRAPFDTSIMMRGPLPGYGYSPTLPMLYQNPLPPGFPVPMPYPRPHP